jgi:hypothetical protein
MAVQVVASAGRLSVTTTVSWDTLPESVKPPPRSTVAAGQDAVAVADVFRAGLAGEFTTAP